MWALRVVLSTVKGGTGGLVMRIFCSALNGEAGGKSLQLTYSPNSAKSLYRCSSSCVTSRKVLCPNEM